jgi:1,4-alpha-glucan branching enzyme
MLSEGAIPEHHLKAFDLTYSWNVYDVLKKVIKSSMPVTIFDDLIKSESYQYANGSLRMRFATNHDKNAWDGPAVTKFTPEGAKVIAVLMFTYPGVPLIYNGEEVGNKKKLNLFEKVDIDWSMGSDFRILYETLGRLRRDHPALRRGIYEIVPNSQSAQVYSFIRSTPEDTVLVIINFNTIVEKVTLTVPSVSTISWVDIFSKEILQMNHNQMDVQLSPFGFALLSPFAKK